jgi:hypothetical protein
MPLETVILENLEKLPDALKADVLQYVQALVVQHEQAIAEPRKPAKRSGFGIWKGKIKIAEDFDAPLEDFKDYM